MAVLERLSAADRKKYAGLWVTVKDSKVLFAANSPAEVASWIVEHKETPDLVFRVLAEGESANWVY